MVVPPGSWTELDPVGVPGSGVTTGPVKVMSVPVVGSTGSETIMVPSSIELMGTPTDIVTMLGSNTSVVVGRNVMVSPAALVRVKACGTATAACGATAMAAARQAAKWAAWDNIVAGELADR